MAGVTLTRDHRRGEWDAGWFVAGEATGMLLHAPAARHRFAAWDSGGRLVYRSNVYDLAADAVGAVPAAGSVLRPGSRRVRGRSDRSPDRRRAA